MYKGTPEQRLWLARQRQEQLIREAQQYRLARRDRPVGHRSVGHRSAGLIRILSGPLRGSLAVARRAISGYRAPRADPCPDRLAS
jgi:hypothetical protein